MQRNKQTGRERTCPFLFIVFTDFYEEDSDFFSWKFLSYHHIWSSLSYQKISMILSSTVDSEKLSDITANSLKKYPDQIKPNRLDWESLSIQEMETWKTKTWIDKEERILLWTNTNEELIIEDGRHLLEAYRRAKKDIPIIKIGFSSNEALSLYHKLI